MTNNLDLFRASKRALISDLLKVSKMANNLDLPKVSKDQL